MIFSAAIEDRQLKFLVKIPCTNEHLVSSVSQASKYMFLVGLGRISGIINQPDI